jgi:hypothetical protein
LLECYGNHRHLSSEVSVKVMLIETDPLTSLTIRESQFNFQMKLFPLFRNKSRFHSSCQSLIIAHTEVVRHGD